LLKVILVAVGVAAIVGFMVYAAALGLRLLMHRAERLPADSFGPRGRQALAGAVSAPADGLTARWRVVNPRVGPGGRFEMFLEFHNVGTRPLGLLRFNLAPIDAEVLGAAGRPVPPTAELSPASRSRVGWGSLEPGKEFVVWVSGGPGATAVAAHLTLGTRRWLLAPGRYTVRATYSSKYYTDGGEVLRRVGATLWSGQIAVPPVELEVLPHRRRAASAPATAPG